MSASFGELFEKHRWRPIRGCPGRYVLAGGPSAVSPRALAGAEVRAEKFETGAAVDIVWVAHLAGGGLISYEKADGSFIHTLNDEHGLARKLADLGIAR